ncbi:hypothetical protein AB0I53_16480 [Saccharopolyspora sp. NPDC050389]
MRDLLRCDDPQPAIEALGTAVPLQFRNYTPPGHFVKPGLLLAIV